MTEIIVVSDTHGYKKYLEYLTEVYRGANMIIHLGDTSADGQKLQGLFPDKTHVINGNCDLMKFGQDEEIIEVEGIKIFACHGHKYSVKSNRNYLAERASSLGCDIALYGHTHRAREETIDGVTVLNPGACSRYGEQSYMILTVSGDSFKSEFVNLGDL